MAIEDYYDGSVTVYEPSYTQDTYGGPVETLTSRGTTDCRCEDVSGEEVVSYGIRNARRVIRIYCTPSFYIHELDMVTFTYNNEALTMQVRLTDRLRRKAEFHHYELIVADDVNQSEHVS